MLLEDFNLIIDTWINELDTYTIAQLLFKPPAGWSLGQLYMHLVDDTNYYMEEMKRCMTTGNDTNGDKSDFAKTLFANNGFPDAAIEGALSNAYIQQPQSKEQLAASLQALKAEYNKLYILIRQTSPKGKTKHPGMNYFNALEWFQFAEMHFRHHLRQKKKIDSAILKAGFK